MDSSRAYRDSSRAYRDSSRALRGQLTSFRGQLTSCPYGNNFFYIYDSFLNFNLKRRKRNRMKGFDYSSDHLYLVTICVKDMLCCFGEIIEVTSRDLYVQEDIFISIYLNS